MRALLVDAGPLIAACFPRDSHHEASIDGFRASIGVRKTTTSLVVAEAATWLRYRVGLSAMLRLRQMLSDLSIGVVRTDADLEDGAWRLLEQRDGLTLSFADAVTAVLFERERFDAVFGFDSDFLALGIPLFPGNRSGEEPGQYIVSPVTVRSAGNGKS